MEYVFQGQGHEDSSYPDEIPNAYLQAFRLRRSNLGLVQKELLVLAVSLLGLWFGFASALNQITKHSILSLRRCRLGRLRGAPPA
jgi:hypothetical protein